jgi:hypothetical protein
LEESHKYGLEDLITLWEGKAIHVRHE